MVACFLLGAVAGILELAQSQESKHNCLEADLSAHSVGSTSALSKLARVLMPKASSLEIDSFVAYN